jgi:AcrR family transcriptional regulator
VAKAADLTTGAAYRVWERQEDFHRDLAAAAIGYRESETIHRTVQLIYRAVEDGAPLSEVLRVGAHAHLHLNSPTDPFLIALSLRTLSGAVPALAEASMQRHADSMAAFEQLYQVMLDRYGRRMRPPLQIGALSHALAALTEGFAMQTMTGLEHPSYELDEVDPGVGREWTLVGLAVEGIVERLTEPVPA